MAARGAVEGLALAGGMACVLRPTLADDRVWCAAVAASTPCLAVRRVGHREWGLRPQTSPPTEMGIVACQGTAEGAPIGYGSSAIRALSNPLSGRWFGCPGAGSIRARDRLGVPGKALMSQCQHAKPLQRERGPENGYPDRLPAHDLNEQRTTNNGLNHPSCPQAVNFRLAFAQQALQDLG